MKPERLVESFDFRGSTVDRENWIIKGVKVLGRTSRNGRVYEDAAIKDSSVLCENLPVTVRGGHNREDRDYHSQNGQLRNGTARSLGTDKAASYYDWHLNPADELTEKICYDAEHFPENVPLSHEVSVYQGEVDEGGILHVERLIEVDGVAAVYRGGTNRSLFESETVQMDLKTLKTQHAELVEQLRTEILAEDTAKNELTVAQKELAKVVAEKESLQEKLNEVESTLSEYRAVEERAAKQKHIHEAAKEVLGSAVSERLVESLLPLGEEQIREVLAEIKASKTANVSQPEPGVSTPDSTSGAAYASGSAPINKIGFQNRF
jgi:hypothetical protein